jgi:hypothetical protein
MKDSDGEYIAIVKGVCGFLIVAALAIWIFLATGCKVLSVKKKETSDSTSVKKETNELSKVDTSKTKSASTNTKETVYYPQPIIVPGKDGETKIVFVPQTVKESGSSSQETNTYDFEKRLNEKIDSVNASKDVKNTDTNAKVGPSFIEWCLIAGLALLLLKNFLPFKITRI